ncbi:hypothetical protein E7V67_013350 [[Empedobacter] haloabium]|uniref:Uncharacterized protein n=1 Tax=[Empedobacter] haloabium TaxID=592317 RepID=A0ABZ1UTM1_9BURK
MKIDKDQVIERCAELGLCWTVAQAIGRESGYNGSAAVCWAIGLEPSSLQPLRPRNWIRMAAQSSSVSYRQELSEAELITILGSGLAPSTFKAHIWHLLDEVPAQILVMAAEQVASQAGVPITAVWANIFTLARSTGSLRLSTWQTPVQTAPAEGS